MITLGDIATRTGMRLEGDGQLSIDGLCGLSDDLPGRISFVTSGKHARLAAVSRIPAFVVKPGVRIEGKACLEHEHPEYAIALIGRLFERTCAPAEERIHPTAIIHPTARVADDARIGPYVVLGADVVIGARTSLHAQVVVMDRTSIGEDCLLYPRVVIREGCVLGNRITLQPGVAIGGDGFGFVTHEGVHVKIPQLGSVVIEDDVEVGANSTIDRGRFTETRIGRGSKIDNLVQVGHNVHMGEGCLLVAQVGVSGSTKLGDRVILAGQVGVAGHLTIGDDVTVLGKSGITKSLRKPGMYAGMPVRPVDSWRRAMAWLYRSAARDAGETDAEE